MRPFSNKTDRNHNRIVSFDRILIPIRAESACRGARTHHSNRIDSTEGVEHGKGDGADHLSAEINLSVGWDTKPFYENAVGDPDGFGE